jgi:putative addiction module component (TIGR02574 family)
MASTTVDVRTLRKEALSLPQPARALLAQELLESLEENTDQREIDALWAAEAERRLDEIKSGKVKCIPGEVVMRRVRNRKK